METRDKHKRVYNNRNNIVKGAQDSTRASDSLVVVQNRFQALSNLEENGDGTSGVHESACSIHERIGQVAKKGGGLFSDSYTSNMKLDCATGRGDLRRKVKVHKVSDTNKEVQSIKPDDKVDYVEFDCTKTASIVQKVKNGNKQCLRHVNVKKITDKCIDLKKCIQQQRNVYGFLPITNLRRLHLNQSLKPNVILNEEQFDPVRVHNIVKATGKYNFEEAKIQMPSTINFELLESICTNYWDYQLPYFLKFGFPLDFPHDCENRLVSTEESHASATKFPAHVSEYINTERAHKAIYGPYTEPPYGSATHVSPFMSREKPDSTNRRIIIDLSWPENASINHFTTANMYLDTVFKLRYPTVDNITEELLRMGGTPHLYKIDLSRAFRQLRIDPRDFNLLTLKWDGAYFADTFCPFGHVGGSMACSRLTDMFRYVMNGRNATVFTYVDDCLGCAHAGRSMDDYNFLLRLLQDLGFPISKNKLVSPTTKCQCLGVVIDTEQRTISVTQEKLSEIVAKCRQTYEANIISKRQLQSVIGSLMFVHKAVRPTRFFVNRLLDSLRAANSRVRVNSEMKKDLSWFLHFMPAFNGTASYDHKDIDYSQTLAVDACLTGVGGVWMNKVYASDIPENLQNQADLNITHYELINILVALRVWGQCWAGQRVCIKTDNAAVVQVCSSGFTRDKLLAAFIRNIWWYTATLDIELCVVHVLGKDNATADLLSRWAKCYNPQGKLQQMVQNPCWYKVSSDYFQVNMDI